MTRPVFARGIGTSPAGPAGKDGLPGINAIPAKDAVDAYNASLLADSASATASALSASIVAAVAASRYATGARLERSTFQSIPSGAWTAVSFDVETRDSHDFHTPSAPERIQIPSGVGPLTMQASGRVVFQAGGAGTLRGVALFVNATLIAERIIYVPGAVQIGVDISLPLDLNDGDFVELRATHDVGFAINVAAGSWFTVELPGKSLGLDVSTGDKSDAGATALYAYLDDLHTINAFTVKNGVSGPTGAVGVKPAVGDSYANLWTRDNAYTIWHAVASQPAAQVRQWIGFALGRRSGQGFEHPTDRSYDAPAPNFVPDRIDVNGTAFYRNPGAGYQAFMDGIAFVVLALWSDWKATGNTATFTTYRTVIDTCLAAIPRSANGCVYSDPAQPSVDYGFTDAILKTGDVAYGTALQAWAYKMLAEIAGETGSGVYTTRRELAQAGLATLRKPTGWYAGSSGNNTTKDDVWATALIVAEGLVADTSDRIESAFVLRDAYQRGRLTSYGWVRHLPVGQYWNGTGLAPDTYQNGAYWLTPLWDCYRAVALVDQDAATRWVNQALNRTDDQVAAEGSVGANTAPYEWFFGSTNSGPKGYTPSAAIAARFA